MRAWIRLPLQLAALGIAGCVALVAVVTGAYYYVEPGLPTADQLHDVSINTPLSVYSIDGRLMQQFGVRRTPAAFDEIPRLLRDAVVAAEDDSFYEHPGIDVLSTIRAVVNYGIQFVTGSEDRVPGGSTITQQIARTTNLLSNDYGLARKIPELFLAFRMEREFTKDEILALYLNTSFYGQNSYGVDSAARTFFNKALDELNLSEIAIIAGIGTAPSLNNPFNGPDRAAVRRDYVLRRLQELGHITAAEREAARAEPIVPQLFGRGSLLEAGYVAEMAMQECERRVGKRACEEDGLRITTTIDSRLQLVANSATRTVLESYDRDHGYRGPLGRIDLAGLGFGADDADELGSASSLTETLTTLLGDYPDNYGTEAGVVLAVDDAYANVFLPSVGGPVSIGFDAVSWARAYIDDNRVSPQAPGSVGDVLTQGDIVRFRRTDDGRYELAQVPEQDRTDYVQGALVSVDPRSGAIVALTGGYDFWHSEFNRATLAKRQPGSAFKPFFYLAALEHGFTLSSIINDAKDCFFDETLERQHCVENFGDDYRGEIRLREVLINSLNAPASRIIRSIGASHVGNYVERFGFDPEPGERNSSLALGGLAVTPVELANGYAILANGGYAVGIPDPATGAIGPYFIQRIEDASGNLLYDANTSVQTVCPEEESAAEAATTRLIEHPVQIFPRLNCAGRVESAQRIFLVTDVLREVITEGSGRRARELGRPDLAGKTGTTTGPRDLWFAGFNGNIVAVVRVGFDDDTRDLGGTREQGGTRALPAWIEFMREALAGTELSSLPMPFGIVETAINPDTGLRAADCGSNAGTMTEYFLVDNLPPQEQNRNCTPSGSTLSDPDSPSSTDRIRLFE
jgi:penicillin-binding protein 1A